MKNERATKTKNTLSSSRVERIRQNFRIDLGFKTDDELIRGVTQMGFPALAQLLSVDMIKIQNEKKKS